MLSYLTVLDGQASPNGGTSAAVPVVSAIMALLNDARFRAGKPAIGFANPWLYSLSSGINDITGGVVLGCGGVDLQTGEEVPGAGIIPYATWNATVGWDPATGLGTPNFGILKKLALEVGGHGPHGYGPHGY
nr:tripeptidyl-peptidase sed4 [Quercus suber]